jgi:hypothetical protein
MNQSGKTMVDILFMRYMQQTKTYFILTTGGPIGGTIVEIGADYIQLDTETNYSDTYMSWIPLSHIVKFYDLLNK